MSYYQFITRFHEKFKTANANTTPISLVDITDDLTVPLGVVLVTINDIITKNATITRENS
jgi:hypothetical protein